MAENREALSDKTLAMLVGPSAIGKSTIMEEIIRQDPNFAYVRTFTTRDPRPGERSHYRHIGKTEADTIFQTGEYITFSEHPTTHNIYGTDLESYPKEYNLLDTLSGNVKDFRTLSFKATTTLGITALTEDWRNWFTHRHPEPTAEAQQRLDEAKLSIEWALADADTHWLVNREGALEHIAQKAIATIVGPLSERSIPDEPYAMLELIEDGVWH